MSAATQLAYGQLLESHADLEQRGGWRDAHLPRPLPDGEIATVIDHYRGEVLNELSEDDIGTFAQYLRISRQPAACAGTQDAWIAGYLRERLQRLARRLLLDDLREESIRREESGYWRRPRAIQQGAVCTP